MSSLAKTCTQAKEAFREVGAVVLRNVFEKDTLRAVASGIARNQKAPSQFYERTQTEEGPGKHFADYYNWKRIPQFKDFVTNSQAAEIAGRLMDSKSAIFYHDFVIIKESGDQSIAPWHQNQSYYPVDGDKNCCIWLPLDPVNQSNGLQFISGSHNWNKWFYPRCLPPNFTSDPLWVKDRQFHKMPDIDEDLKAGKHTLVNFDVEPGDCVVYHMKTLYMSPPNNGKRTRRVLSTRWLGDDAVLARRPWVASPPVLGGLKQGMKIKSEVFPEMWTLNGNSHNRMTMIQ